MPGDWGGGAGAGFAQTLEELGRIRAQQATQQGQIWGNTISNIGQQVGNAIEQAPVRAALAQERQQRGLELQALTQEQQAKAQDRLRQQQGDAALGQAIADPANQGDPQQIAAVVAKAGYGDHAQKYLQAAVTTSENVQKLAAAKQAARDREHQLVADAFQGVDPTDETDVKARMAALHQQGLDMTPWAQILDQRGAAAGIKSITDTAPENIKAARTRAEKAAEEAAKVTVIPRGGTAVQGGQVVGTGQAPAMTETELASDAENPNSPTQAQSAAALARLRTRVPAATGSFEDYVIRKYGPNATPDQIIEARKTYGPAGERPPAAPPGAGASAASTGLQGDEFLATLPAAVAAQIKGLDEGRIPFPSAQALRTPYWQDMLTKVANYDPTFDAVNYNARSKTRNAFTSGKEAGQINALNTVIGHLDNLSDAADALKNGDVQLFNRVANAYTTATGNPTVTNFNVIRKAVADELTRVWRQAGGSEADIKENLQNLDAANSPAQLHGAVATFGHLLESKLSSLNEQYKQGMGTDKIDIVTPGARETLTKLEKRAGGGTSAPAPTPTGGRRIVYDINGNVVSDGR